MNIMELFFFLKIVGMIIGGGLSLTVLVWFFWNTWNEVNGK